MGRQLVLLAPPGTTPGFGHVRHDPARWNRILLEAGRTRGRVYLADGAIGPNDLGSHGELMTPMDRSSWHFASIDPDGSVASTLRITATPLSLNDRRGRLPHIGDSLYRSDEGNWRRLAAERYLSALALNFGSKRPLFFIVGGWAADPAASSAGEGAELALATWAFARVTPCAGAITVASERHDAHGQLVRTGAVPIRPKRGSTMYFDPHYGCRVGLLGYTVFQEAPALTRIVDRFTKKLLDCEVLTCSNPHYSS